MKLPFKIAIGFAFVFALVAGYFFIDSDSATTLPVEPVEEQKDTITPTSKLDRYLGKKLDNTTNDTSEEATFVKEARIKAVISKAEEQYLAIIQLSGASGEETLAYEDDWCVAHEDLSEEDAIYAANQLKEWELSRGEAIPRGGSGNALWCE